MTTYLQARSRILDAIPDMDGWTVHRDGQAPPSATPPWVVVSVRETGRARAESGYAGAVLLEVRLTVVSAGEASVNAKCEQLHDLLDNLRPDGLGPLTALRDSGSYPSDLTDTRTGMAWTMRVLQFTTSYTTQKEL